MYTGNQNSLFVKESIKYGIDSFLITHFDKILWLKKGYSLLNDVILEIAPRALELVPRTAWYFVQAIVGFDQESHMSPDRMPMLAKNDVGGTGTVNLKHWDQMMKTGRFATLERDGQPAKDYPVEKLAKNLNNTDLLIFVGSNDALADQADFMKLLAVLPDSDSTVVQHINDYNHNDYMWAQDAHQLINVDGGLLDFITKHSIE